MRLHRTLATALVSGALTTPAFATWSIILIDTRTGEVAIGSATCLTSFDLRAGTPVLIPGIGGATAQSFVDSTGQNRVFIRDRLAEGVEPAAIISQLATFDAGHQTRQYGIADATLLTTPPGRAATFSGTSAGAWAGGQTGHFTSSHGGHPATIVYAIQGNILTGAPVVNAAVQAVIATEGDLAAKMMAGMQAARSMGGDGRCSCAAGPTACGSPPPSFTKSAHIAYMLIARPGDREGSNGIYRAGAGAGAIAAADITGDGRPDLLLSNATANSLSLQTNTTGVPSLPGPLAPPAPFPKFASLPTSIASVGASPRGLAFADLLGGGAAGGDGTLDGLVAAANSNSVVLFAGGNGALGTPISIAVGASPRAIATGDFDAASSPPARIDFASVNAIGNSVSVRLNQGNNQFAITPDIPVSPGPLDIVAGDFGGTPHLDLAVLCRTANRIDLLLGDGAGQFVAGDSLPIAANAAAFTSGDFNGDGRPDLALVTDTTRQLQVLLNLPGGWTTATLSLTALTTLSDTVAGDLDLDGDIDLVAVGGSRFAVLRNDGGGAFTVERTYTISSSATGATLADLDGDGDLDLAIASSGLSSSIIVQNYATAPCGGMPLAAGAPLFNDGIGCGTGDYYMNFNVAFQSAAAPDPVIQLQGLYDSWRTALAGTPDAMGSSAAFDASWLGPGATATLTITLRDWQGNPVDPVPPAADITITHDCASGGGSAGISSIGPVQALGNGIYAATVSAPGPGAATGLDRFRIRIAGNPPLPRPVTLSPSPVLALTACYANCDGSTQPPVLNIADFACFVTRFAAGEAIANCDNSTQTPVLNVADFGCFLTKFAAGCP